MGGSAPNYALMEALKWSADEYWRLRDKLIESGVIVRGKGRGGSVWLVVDEGVPGESALAATPHLTGSLIAEAKPRESDLYGPCLEVLKTAWAHEQGVEQLHLELTAQQGSRATGGTWTRPDIAGVSVRTFKYWPGRIFDLWTFEIKPTWSFDVVGIFEAAAHSRYASYSLALFHVTDDQLKQEQHVGRMVSEAQRFGVGLIMFTDPRSFKDWYIKTEPVRQTPDPALHEEFVSAQLGEEAKEKLLKWSKS
jgi:hypothetical protein